jgi:hypothetical protein
MNKDDLLMRFNGLVNLVSNRAFDCGECNVDNMTNAQEYPLKYQNLVEARKEITKFVLNLIDSLESAKTALGEGVDGGKESKNEIDGNLVEVARHMEVCAGSWSPRVRLIGNCRAEDIQRIAAEYLELKKKG